LLVAFRRNLNEGLPALLRQSKFHYLSFINYFFMFFWLEPKEPKIQGKTNGSARFSGQRTLDSDNSLVDLFFAVVE